MICVRHGTGELVRDPSMLQPTFLVTWMGSWKFYSIYSKAIPAYSMFFVSKLKSNCLVFGEPPQ